MALLAVTPTADERSRKWLFRILCWNGHGTEWRNGGRRHRRRWLWPKNPPLLRFRPCPLSACASPPLSPRLTQQQLHGRDAHHRVLLPARYFGDDRKIKWGHATLRLPWMSTRSVRGLAGTPGVPFPGGSPQPQAISHQSSAHDRPLGSSTCTLCQYPIIDFGNHQPGLDASAMRGFALRLFSVRCALR